MPNSNPYLILVCGFIYTIEHADMDARNRLETLAEDITPKDLSFKQKLNASTLSSTDITKYTGYWNWCNQYMHVQDDGKFPNNVVKGKEINKDLKGKHKFQNK